MLAFSFGAVPALLAVAGVAVLALSAWGARYEELHPLEVRVFHAVNELPDWLYVPLWLPMQFGNLVVGLLAGLVVAWLVRVVAIAIAVVAATVAKLVIERVIRDKMAGFATVRQRPGTSE